MKNGKKMSIYYDAEGDYLEICFGKPKPSYFEKIAADTFERRDKETGQILGYAFHNVKKRQEKQPQSIEVQLPAAA